MDSIAKAPQHGGQLQAAATSFGIPLNQWLDLSTGINPYSWPVPDIPATVWQRLPEDYDALETAAKSYYGKPMLAIPGSQWAIQTLPSLFSKRRVWLPEIGYEEHPYWWQFHRHEIILYNTLPDADELQPRDAVVVINPNNPTTFSHTAKTLLCLSDALEKIDGHLIVDEAFADTNPIESLLNYDLNDSVILLRSLGKFFGLAGLRLGFVYCSQLLKNTLKEHMGPWAISHASAYIGERALFDKHWHRLMQDHLKHLGKTQQKLIQNHFPKQKVYKSDLFITLHLSESDTSRLYTHCAKHGILIRQFPKWDLIRLGLSQNENLEKLNNTLLKFRIDQ